MKKLLELLGACLGTGTIALEDGDVGADVAGKLEALAKELPGLREAAAARVADHSELCKALALSEDSKPEVIRGAVLAMVAKAKLADELDAKVKTLALEAETRRKTDIIERGKAEGKLPPAMIDWASKQDAAVLEAYLAVAPVIVPTGTIDRAGLPPDAPIPDAVLRDVATRCGLDPAVVAKIR